MTRIWGVLALLVVLAAVLFVAYRNPSGPGEKERRLTRGGGQVDALRRDAGSANVVICVIDAARADHFGCYGYERDATPNIDRLARECFVFDNHYCQIPSTKESTASLFTGQYPDTHLAIGMTGGLSPSKLTLAKAFRALGDVKTVFLTANTAASPSSGIGLDFEEIYYAEDKLGPYVSGDVKRHHPEVLVNAFEDWLGRNREARFCAYLHFLPPHYPYEQPDEMTRLFEDEEPPGLRAGPFEFPVGEGQFRATHPPLPGWVNLYDSNLHYGDWAVGQIEQFLREAGILDNTIFIVTSDHGEAFGEHGYLWHLPATYDEMIRVPLLIRLPGAERRVGRFSALTETVGILPTILDLLNVDYSGSEIQGRSLVPMLAGRADSVKEHALSRAFGRPASYMIRDSRYSLLLYGNGEWRALYDLQEDPGQTRNVIAERPEAAAALTEAFRAFADTQARPLAGYLDPAAEAEEVPETSPDELPPNVARELRALGYLQ